MGIGHRCAVACGARFWVCETCRPDERRLPYYNTVRVYDTTARRTRTRVFPFTRLDLEREKVLQKAGHRSPLVRKNAIIELPYSTQQDPVKSVSTPHAPRPHTYSMIPDTQLSTHCTRVTRSAPRVSTLHPVMCGERDLTSVDLTSSTHITLPSLGASFVSLRFWTPNYSLSKKMGQSEQMHASDYLSAGAGVASCTACRLIKGSWPQQLPQLRWRAPQDSLP